MTFPHPSSASLNILHRADGSATYSQNGYTIIGAVNGPVEVQRRDELPEEAAIEVNVRPAVGVGGVRERHLESLIHSSLRHVILVQNHPRTLIQVTLQISSTPENASTTSQSSQYSSVYFSPGSFALYNADDYVQSLPLIPSLLQTALLALLSASIPLSVTFTATILAVSPSSKLIQDPSPTLLREATSIHVLAFSSHGELLLAESEGDFGIETWEKVYHEAERICRGENEDSEEDVSMRKEDGEGLEGFLKDVVREKVGRDIKWKDGTI